MRGRTRTKKSQNIYVSKPLIRLDDTFSSRPTRVEQKPSKWRRRSRANKSIFYNFVFVVFLEGFLAKNNIARWRRKNIGEEFYALPRAENIFHGFFSKASTPSASSHPRLILGCRQLARLMLARSALKELCDGGLWVGCDEFASVFHRRSSSHPLPPSSEPLISIPK
jgi:hypothetical protein